MRITMNDGVGLAVEVAGSGPGLMLVHGLGGAKEDFADHVPALARDHTVVVFDHRGHGSSDKPTDRTAYSIDRLAHDILDVADGCELDRFRLLGHSMGGMTLMALAIQRPELIKDRVLGVAFVATSPGGLSAVSWGLGNLLGRAVHRLGPVAVGQLAGRQGLVNAALKAGRDVEEFLVDRYSFASPVPLSIVRLTADMIFGTRIEVISEFMETFDKHDKRQALEQFIGVETLVINGVQDLLTPPQHSEEIVRLIPGAEHVLINDAGHIIMLEHGDVVSEQLLALIARAQRAAAAHIDLRSKPRVRRLVTDLAKRRRVEKANGRRDNVS